MPVDSKNATQEQEVKPSRIRRYAAILLFAVIAVIVIDGYFSNWSIIRTLISLNTLRLQDRSDRSWDLLERRDFRLVKLDDIRSVLDIDSLMAIDKPYREAGYYRLYFRTSDSSSTKLEKMYETLLSYDTAHTIQRTVQDARRAYTNLQHLLHPGSAGTADTANVVQKDSTPTVMQSDIQGQPSDEVMAVAKKIMSDPRVLAGVGIGIVASAGIDFLRGNAFVAYAPNDVFKLDSLKVGSRVGTWEGTPIDILWAFGKQDTTATTNMPKDSVTTAKADSGRSTQGNGENGQKDSVAHEE